jgi:hypothetical protein
MIRLIAVAGFALAVATSAQAMTPAPIAQPDGMITQVAVGCGAGRTMVAGRCVARTTIRQTRRPSADRTERKRAIELASLSNASD